MHTILFLAANPAGTERLALDHEARAIHAEIERSTYRDRFQLVTRWAAQPLDLLRELRKLKPTIVHFSGHGWSGRLQPDGSGNRDVSGGGATFVDNGGQQRGLLFEGHDGRPLPLSTEVLEETFSAAGTSVRLVVLNACYSEAHAEALLAHVDSVVGMTGAVSDLVARNFAVGFYGGLGDGEPLALAHKQGCAAASLHGVAESERPKLRARVGVESERLALSTVSRERGSATESAKDPLEYYVYISDAKVEMLLPQINCPTGTHDGSMPTRGPSRVGDLRSVVQHLRARNTVGLHTDELEYVEGTLDFRWGLLQFVGRRVNLGEVAYFASDLCGVSLLMVGSAHHVVGAPLSPRLTGGSSYWCARELVRVLEGELQPSNAEGGDWLGELGIDGLCQHGLKDGMWPDYPTQKLRFLAKRYGRFASRFGPIVLGSPIFVSMAE